VRRLAALLPLLAIWLLPGCRDGGSHDRGADEALPDDRARRPAASYLDEAPPLPAIDWRPRAYDARAAPGPIRVDGILDEEAWRVAPWTDRFVDIEGDARPEPRLATRAKILWNDEALWIGAEIEEPHVWGSLRQRDAVIYMDDDFEVFLDPDGDTHQYYEIEINALGTVWDLLLVRPYRDGGPAVHAWDIPGLRTAVHVAGTINDPSDEDRGWSVEIGIPWGPLAEATDVPVPPRPGDRWRVNFSRVDWSVDIFEGEYRKRRDPASGDELEEANWVWSPQGLVAMHYPEMWGFVRFVGGGTESPPASAAAPTAAERAAWELRLVYYAEREHRARTGRFTDDAGALGLAPPLDASLPWPPRISASADQFEARLVREDGTLLARIDHEGRVRTGP
jgi:hypothetical protein